MTTKKPFIPPTHDQPEDQTVVSPIQSLDPFHGSERKPTLVMISGTQLGRSFEIDKDEFMVGRVDNCDLVVEDDLVSRHHCKIILTPDGAQIVDLASTNGTLVNGRRIDKVFLKEGDQIQVGSIAIFKFSMQGEAEAKFMAQLFTAATKDFLTNAYNKKFFVERLQSEFFYTLRHGGNLAILVLDIDHFKKVNDTYGHLAGDQALKLVALHLANNTRKDDMVARFGGEEFVILMRDCDLEQAKVLAEHLREGISKINVSSGDQKFSVTASIGISTLSEANRKSMQSPEILIDLADQRLYKAKQSGRNRVCA